MTDSLGEDAVVALVDGLLDRIESLEARVSQLESQFQKTSRNSHKPPSSDGFKKRPRQRKRSRRASGGQPKHPGSTLEWSERVDETVVHPVLTCQSCGHALDNLPIARLDARQVHDLPPLSMQVFEHHAEEKHCPGCGQVNRAQFPAEVSAPVQYGPRVKGLLVYLMDGQLLPSKRVQEFLSEVYECHLSEGSLYRHRTQCYQPGRLTKVVLGISQSSKEVEPILD